MAQASRSRGIVDQPGRLKLWVEKVRRLLEDKEQDLWLPVTGPRGNGKSTLMLYLAGLIDPTFPEAELEERMAWNSTYYRQVLEGLDRGQAAILDEFRGFWAREATTSENRSSQHAVMEDRKWGHVKLVAGLSWEEFDSVFRAVGPRWRVVVKRPGLARMRPASRGSEGKNQAWGRGWLFSFPSLEGTGVWRAYQALARDHGVHGDEGEGQVEQAREPMPVQLFHRYEGMLEGLVAAWCRSATQTLDGS